MKDNSLPAGIRRPYVVNCFQKLLSSWWRTTQKNTQWFLLGLWIAFKNYYLRDEGQPQRMLNTITLGCELLSKIIIFVMKDNNCNLYKIVCRVVNCFQKLLSSWWRTTGRSAFSSSPWLWIAFKNYYLRDEGQQHHRTRNHYLSCELLSKIIIFVMKDNIQKTSSLRMVVVNCFQKLLSSWWRTTKTEKRSIQTMLWIAFKNYYLRDEGQRFIWYNCFYYSCELLSKIIIFVMKDNDNTSFASICFVVNCFQKLLSSWWRTTNLYANVPKN